MPRKSWEDLKDRIGTPWDKHAGPAKFECPACGQLLQIFHNDPFWQEALRRAKSCTPKQADEIMKRTGRCPICDRQVSKRREERELAERDGPLARRARPDSSTGQIFGLPPFAWVLIGVGTALVLFMGIIFVILIVGASQPNATSTPPARNATSSAQYAACSAQFAARPHQCEACPPNRTDCASQNAARAPYCAAKSSQDAA
jgi:hypothetical protein